jgi:ATP-dependent Clp protease ATP-binding subunit ClpX
MNCSFCGKRSDEVFRIISSDGSKICNECVGRCCDMLSGEYQKTAKEIEMLRQPREDT